MIFVPAIENKHRMKRGSAWCHAWCHAWCYARRYAWRCIRRSARSLRPYRVEIVPAFLILAVNCTHLKIQINTQLLGLRKCIRSWRSSGNTASVVRKIDVPTAAFASGYRSVATLCSYNRIVHLGCVRVQDACLGWVMLCSAVDCIDWCPVNWCRGLWCRRRNRRW